MFACGFQNPQWNYSSVHSFIPNSASICVYAFTLIIFYCLNLVKKLDFDFGDIISSFYTLLLSAPVLESSCLAFSLYLLLFCQLLEVSFLLICFQELLLQNIYLTYIYKMCL